jgi:hypothetical protein
MALTKTIQKKLQGFDGALSVKDCYIKVMSISGDKQNMTYHVAFINLDTTVDSVNHSFTPDMLSGDNFIKQAYLHLKTLPEFVGATDV